jgi:hypothetical protein
MKAYKRRVMSLNKKGPYQGFSYKKKGKIAKRGGEVTNGLIKEDNDRREKKKDEIM